MAGKRVFKAVKVKKITLIKPKAITMPIKVKMPKMGGMKSGWGQ